jgi:phenylpyruvate tautomerase PptA (4-oxalocrotonate tautomerase family)
MPMIDLTVPHGALDAHALVDAITRAVVKWEGFAGNPRADAASWGFVNELAPGGQHIGHQRNDDGPARYRVVATVPEGALDDEARAGLVTDVTRLILEHEGSPVDVANAGRIWVFINEIPDGRWGGNGRIMRREDIARAFGGDDSVLAEGAKALSR